MRPEKPSKANDIGPVPQAAIGSWRASAQMPTAQDHFLESCKQSWTCLDESKDGRSG